MQNNIGPPGIAHDSLPLVSRARPSGELSVVLDRFAPATPSFHSVAAFASLVVVVLFLITTARLDSPGRPDPLSFRFAVWQVNRAVCRIPVHRFCPEGGDIMNTASPQGEEEAGPKGAERGGYSPIPRRDARVGEWYTSKCKR